MVKATEFYAADRGGECDITAPRGETIKVFYFEWDRLKAGPAMAICGHAPEVCNVVAGFKLLGIEPVRTYSTSHGPLEFDATVFLDRSGNRVYMYKIAWMQGFGAADLRIGQNRLGRVRASTQRHVGSARVLQGAVTGASDTETAWQLFTSEVLEKLKWE